MQNPFKAQLKREGLVYRPILGESSAKTIKGQKIGYLTAICYLVPDEKLCPFAQTAGNYDLTYSFSAITPKPISIKGLTNRHNQRAAVVFQRQADIPAEFRGWPVVDGDDTDVRHIEPAGVVVALYAKGKAKRDTGGFVQIKGRDY